MIHTFKKVQKYKIKESTRIISRDSFRNCEVLQDLELSSNLNFIGETVFVGCRLLGNLILPNSLLYIGNGAFWGIGEKNNKLQITIPQSVVMIDGNPFDKNILIKSDNNNFKVIDNILYSSDGKTLISYCSNNTDFIVPEGVERIGKYAFYKSPIRKIHFPETLKVIEESAFSCVYEMEDLLFPESLREIQERAFEDLHSFPNGCVRLPSKIEIIGEYAFDYGWTVHVFIVPPGCIKHYSSILHWRESQIVDYDVICENGLLLNVDRTEVIAEYEKKQNIIIPEGIKKIRKRAFYRYEVESITFPSSLIDVSVYSFESNACLNVLPIKNIFVPKVMVDYFKNKLPEYANVITYQPILNAL